MRGSEVYVANQWAMQDERFLRLSHGERMLYAYLLKWVDDEGILMGDPEYLANEVLEEAPQYRAWIDQFIRNFIFVGLVEDTDDGNYRFVGFVVPGPEHEEADYVSK